MARPRNSKDAVAASMKRRLNPDDYMSDPKKTSITMDPDGSPRSYFRASNSLAQLRSRNPLPERYKGGSGGMVDIDGQQYYQPGILNKEDIASRFRSQGVNPDAKNYGLRGEEDKFTGRADSSIASMSPDTLRELVGGVAMRVEDAENKRYANMFLKIHDTVEEAPNMKEALHESSKLVPLGPDGVSMAADRGLTRSDIEAMGAAQRGALADRYARDAVQNRERVLRGADEKERLANADRIFARSDKEYMEEMDAGSERERRRIEEAEEKERRAAAASGRPVRDILDTLAEEAATGKKGAAKTTQPLSEKSQTVRDILDTLAEEAATGKKGAAGTNALTPEQRTRLHDLLDKVNQQVEMNKKYAAEDAPGEGRTEAPVEEEDAESWGTNARPGAEDPASYREASATYTPPKTNAPPSRSLPATAPYRSPEWTRREQEAEMEEAGRRNKQWDDLTKKLMPKQDAKFEALRVEAEKKGLSKAEVESRAMDIHLLMDPESEAAFAPLRREEAKAQETERQRWAKIHAEIRQAKEQAKEQETDLDRYYTPRKVYQLKAELTRRLNNANPLGGRPPLRRSGPLPFGLDRLFPEAPPPNVSREQYVNGPYVDTKTNRYVIGPAHPLFELEKQQQYRRGFVTKYNAEGGFYYTQFDKDVAYSYGVLNDE